MQGSVDLYRRLLAWTRPYARGYVAATIGMVFAALTEPLFPALMKTILDEGFARHPTFSLWLVPAAVVGIFVVRGIATFCAQYALAWVSQKTLVDLRRQMFEHVLRLPTQEFDREASGVLISRVVFEVNSVLDMACSVLTTFVRDSLVVVGLLGWLLWLNWRLTLVALVLIPSLALVMTAFSARMRRLNRVSLEHTSELTRVVEEAVHGHKVIKVFDAYAREARILRETVERLRGFSMRMTIASSVTTPMTQIVAAVAVAAVLTIALMQSHSNQTTIGGFVSFITGMMMLLAPMKRLAEVNGPLQRGLAAADKVFELLDREIEIDDGTRRIGRSRGGIAFRNVSFRYPGANADAISSVDLLVRPGEVVALVGSSGSGKTTLMNLVPRFLRPTAGSILLDEMPAAELTLSSLRSQMALVSQEIVLFNDTIRENVTFGSDGGADDSRVWRALADAALDQFVRSLPQGLDSMVGERGAKLSGGQRQRLAIARALLKDAPILLLDEATSALDSRTELEVQRALERTMKGRTTLVIAHRLSTVERADRIVVLAAGRIVEQGRHQDLLAAGGAYARLYQRASFEDEGSAQLAGRDDPGRAASA